MAYDPLRCYVRAATVRVVDRSDAAIVIGQQGVVRRYADDSAALVRVVLEIHGRPVDRAAVLAALGARATGEVPIAPVDELLALLVEDGVIVPDGGAEGRGPARAGPFALRRVVVGISGAVAAVDAPTLVRGLQALGCEVRVALTKAARRFVAVAALEAITHHGVWQGLWQRDARVPVPHVNLAEWAELVIVYPASATTIARIASGDCSELVAAIVAATRAPVVIAPSMNDAMLASPAVQRNLETLRDDGRWIVHPAFGVEVAHRPEARSAMLGPAPPPATVVDLVRVLLGDPRPWLPHDAAGWERVWATTALEQLPWHVETIEAPLAAALDARTGTLIDLGTGAGTIAIEAARRGFAVTATDVAPTALGRARERAADLPILFVLDDVTRTRLTARFQVAVDHGLLHCLPRDRWPAYASAVTELVTPGGSLLIVAHEPGGNHATTPVTADDLATLLPAFALVGSAPTCLARSDARLFELQLRAR